MAREFFLAGLTDEDKKLVTQILVSVTGKTFPVLCRKQGKIHRRNIHGYHREKEEQRVNENRCSKSAGQD